MGIPAISLALSAVSGISGGIQASNQAKAEKEAAEINSFVGRTRAMQTDTSARQGLSAELATLRATLNANQQRPNVGTGEISRDLRAVRSNDRRVEFGNRMQESASFRTEARFAGSRSRGALLGGFIKAGPSLFDLYQLNRG